MEEIMEKGREDFIRRVTLQCKLLLATRLHLIPHRGEGLDRLVYVLFCR